jgi:dihydroneopterin aldolase
VRIEIRGLEVYAYHGVPDAEQTVGHRYRLDLDLEIAELASETDAIADTLDYGALMVFAQGFLAERQFRTLERLAAALAAQILADHARVSEVEVAIGKPLPPAPVIAAFVGVRYRARRNMTG